MIAFCDYLYYTIAYSVRSVQSAQKTLQKNPPNLQVSP